MSENTKEITEGKVENVDKSEAEVEKTEKTELDYIRETIVENATKYIPKNTANDVTKRAKGEIDYELDKVMQVIVERNVKNAIGDALVEVKKYFMGIAEMAHPEEKEK